MGNYTVLKTFHMFKEDFLRQRAGSTLQKKVLIYNRILTFNMSGWLTVVKQSDEMKAAHQGFDSQ